MKYQWLEKHVPPGVEGVQLQNSTWIGAGLVSVIYLGASRPMSLAWGGTVAVHHSTPQSPVGIPYPNKFMPVQPVIDNFVEI